jgi:cbb3-type cytochrome oxidase subunit 1
VTGRRYRDFLRIAVIYALVAMFLGITMGIREDFTQASTHAHLNLVGWVSMALYALVYRQYPAAAQSRFAMLHFWILITRDPQLITRDPQLI